MPHGPGKKRTRPPKNKDSRRTTTATTTDSAASVPKSSKAAAAATANQKSRVSTPEPSTSYSRSHGGGGSGRGGGGGGGGPHGADCCCDHHPPSPLSYPEPSPAAIREASSIMLSLFTTSYRLLLPLYHALLLSSSRDSAVTSIIKDCLIRGWTPEELVTGQTLKGVRTNSHPLKGEGIKGQWESMLREWVDTVLDAADGGLTNAGGKDGVGEEDDDMAGFYGEDEIQSLVFEKAARNVIGLVCDIADQCGHKTTEHGPPYATMLANLLPSLRQELKFLQDELIKVEACPFPYPLSPNPSSLPSAKVHPSTVASEKVSSPVKDVKGKGKAVEEPLPSNLSPSEHGNGSGSTTALRPSKPNHISQKMDRSRSSSSSSSTASTSKSTLPSSYSAQVDTTTPTPIQTPTPTQTQSQSQGPSKPISSSVIASETKIFSREANFEAEPDFGPLRKWVKKRIENANAKAAAAAHNSTASSRGANSRFGAGVGWEDWQVKLKKAQKIICDRFWEVAREMSDPAHEASGYLTRLNDVDGLRLYYILVIRLAAPSHDDSKDYTDLLDLETCFRLASKDTDPVRDTPSTSYYDVKGKGKMVDPMSSESGSGSYGKGKQKESVPTPSSSSAAYGALSKKKGKAKETFFDYDGFQVDGNGSRAPVDVDLDLDPQEAVMRKLVDEMERWTMYAKGKGKLDKVEQAAEEKQKGNAAFEKTHYELAVKHYTRAIEMNPGESTYVLNRAAAFFKLDLLKDSECDCTLVLKKEPNNFRALCWRALARKALGKDEAAVRDLLRARKIQPSEGAIYSEVSWLAPPAAIPDDVAAILRKSTSSSASPSIVY